MRFVPARRVGALLAAALAIATGCSSDSTGPEHPIVGTYSLVAIAGKPVPTTTVLDGVTRSVQNGTLSVTDSTYKFVLCITFAGGGGVCGAGKTAVSDSGYVWWSSVGASFVAPGSFRSRGLIVSGDTLTLDRGDFGPTLTFAR